MARAKLNKKLTNVKDQTIEFIATKSKPYVRDAKNYWLRLSEREQFIVKGGGILLALMLLFLFVSSFFSLEGTLQQNIRTNSENLATAKILKLQMQDLNSITANEFTQVSAARVKDDIKGLFAIDNPNVALNDNTLIISLNGVKFELVMLFLDQLRKSYGIFPDKLKIYRSTQSGVVDFYATFHIED